MSMTPELTSLRSILIKTNFPQADCLNYPILFNNAKVQECHQNFIKVLEYFFKEYDLPLIQKLKDSPKSPDNFISLEGSSVSFINAVFKIMRDFFDVKLKLTAVQFNNEKKFLLQKIILCTVVAKAFYSLRSKKKKVLSSSTSDNVLLAGASVGECLSKEVKYKEDGIMFWRDAKMDMTVCTLDHIDYSKVSEESKSIEKEVVDVIRPKPPQPAATKPGFTMFCSNHVQNTHMKHVRVLCVF